MGLFGNDYGFEDELGVSPTEREFDRATELDKHRLIFVLGAEDGKGHPKMLDLIERAQPGLFRRRFATQVELVAGLCAALLQYLKAKDLLRFGPFDAARCSGATLDDLDVEGRLFTIFRARSGLGGRFPGSFNLVSRPTVSCIGRQVSIYCEELVK